MRVSAAFLVNTKNFDTIISALATCNAQVINVDVVQELGYSDPNDLLVVRLLKDFEIITDDGLPAKYFDEFQNPETTKYALARGFLEAYSSLFEKHPSIHHSPPDKVKEAFEEIFSGKKTNLIIKYITGTFLCVAAYCGLSVIDAIQGGEEEQVFAHSSVTNGQNGFYKNERSITEEIGDKTIDDLVSNFSFQKGPIKNGTEMQKPEEISNNETTNEDINSSFENTNHNNSEAMMANHDYNIDSDPFGLDAPSPGAPNSDHLNGESNPLNDTPNHNSKPKLNGSSSLSSKSTRDEFIQKALFRKSDLLYKMQRWESLLPTLEEIIKRYDNPDHENLNETVSRSIIHRAIVLIKLKRLNEALPALDSVIEHFKDSENKEFYHKASMAMIYKVQILENKDDADLLPLYNAIIERMASHPAGMLGDKLDEIHLKRFDLILARGETDEILDASAKLIERFKDSQKHSAYLQKAMIQRAEILDEMNRDEDALQAYEDFLAVFG
ncbi:MAG TPA: DUF5343 domain-containing protein [Balneolaceae bacterium]